LEGLFDMFSEHSLRDVLSYDLETGEFTWKKDMRRAKAGSRAGYKRPDGYRIITVFNYQYRAGRLAWFFNYGKWPSSEIDHINGTRDDDRIANLRIATRSQNVANTRKKCSSRNLLKGVTLARCGKRYMAQIRIGGKNTRLGTYDSEQEAHEAYLAAAQKEFGAFARAG
jgi:hypothetical protein